MIDSRDKGAAAERELAGLLLEELGVKLIRNLDQSRAGGHDLTVAPAQSGPVARALARLAIEVKRHRRASPCDLHEWWEQAERQAKAAGLLPVLAYREDRRPWRVVVPLTVLRPTLGDWRGLGWTAEVSLEGFAALIREGAADASD